MILVAVAMGAILLACFLLLTLIVVDHILQWIPYPDDNEQPLAALEPHERDESPEPTREA